MRGGPSQGESHVRLPRSFAQRHGPRGRRGSAHPGRAAESVSLNISEGRMRAGLDRADLYRRAAGSAGELTTALRIARARRPNTTRSTSSSIACARCCGGSPTDRRRPHGRRISAGNQAGRSHAPARRRGHRQRSRGTGTRASHGATMISSPCTS
ncbi:MAG: four helix bundle protein, partial [Acidobacteriota bacterium]